MLLPQTAEYALRAVMLLALRGPNGPVTASEIAAELRLPQNNLSTTLHQLVRASALTSARGPGGGFRLAQPATALTLERIVAVFSETGERRCLPADRPCGSDPTCPVHSRWAPVAAGLHDFFRGTTLADLVAGPSPNGSPTAPRDEDAAPGLLPFLLAEAPGHPA